MNKINFQDLPNQTTPINATNLNQLQTNVENAINEIVDVIYPVGSLYMSVNSTNPATLFGGTWEAWGTGRVPVGIDTSQTEFNAVEKTGGEKTHQLTVSEMPAHNHNLSVQGGSSTSYGFTYDYSSDKRMYGGTDIIENTGEGQAHNNLQPYITCYMWKRTA